ncbi:MAG: hypothetical protein ACRDJF_09705 [Actinomycetota bacterium]
MPPMALLGTVIGGLALIGILLVAIFGPRFARKEERGAHVYEGEARPWDDTSKKKKRFLSRRS